MLQIIKVTVKGITIPVDNNNPIDAVPLLLTQELKVNNIYRKASSLMKKAGCLVSQDFTPMPIWFHRSIDLY